MTPVRAYLDHNASSPIRPEAAAAVAAAVKLGANPSSIHAEGRAARAIVERARASVAALVGAEAEDVIFTSGGTEANATVLRPGALLAAGRPVERLVLPATEHPSVLGGHGFAAEDVAIVRVSASGPVDEAALDAALDRSDAPALLSIQLANSETGVLQPVPRLAALARSRGHAIHADAVQAAGRLPLDMAALGLDGLTLSGHKIGAPAGIGALVARPGRAGLALGLLRGGGQEGRRRAGTENLAGIAGFGAAAEAARRDLAGEAVRLRGLRDAAERAIRRIAPAALVFGDRAERAPNTLAFAVPGLSAETALIALDLAGIAVSSGSACSSGKVGSSHVLAAMGVPAEVARGAIRLSFGWSSTEDDVARFAKAFESLVDRLYGGGRARAA